MTEFWKVGVIVGLFVGTTAYALAEDLTLTTYYPSPRGVYDELQSATLTLSNPGDATINGGLAVGPTYTPGAAGTAIFEGNVGIGTSAPVARLHINSATPNTLTLETGPDRLEIRVVFGGPGIGDQWGIVTPPGGVQQMYIGPLGGGGPPFRLQVNGTLAVTDGTQGAGRVMTSDAAGNASWQPATLSTLNTGVLDGTTENSSQETTLVSQGCVKLNNESAIYGSNHWMSCPAGMYVAAITDDYATEQDVLCCPF